MSIATELAPQFVTKGAVGFSNILPTSSILWLLASSPSLCQGIITNISVIQGIGWYLPLTFYETILIGFVLAQVSVLQVIGVLPININKALYGDPSGRRKRSISKQFKNSSSAGINNVNEELAERILTVLRGLDKYECIFRTLCEVQKQTVLGYTPPEGLQMTMDGFKLTSQRRQKELTMKSSNNSRPDETEPKSLSYFEEAVNLGAFAASNRNSTTCEQRYSNCLVTAEEIIEYVDQMYLDDFF